MGDVPGRRHGGFRKDGRRLKYPRRAEKNRPSAHTFYMRLSANICVINLIVLGICGGIYAFTGFNVLYFICFKNITALRAVLGVCFVSALFGIYAMIAFRPFKGLK